MSNPNFPIIDRRNNGSMKWEEQYITKRFEIEDFKEIYPLFIADMDFAMSKDIKNKMDEYLKTPDFGYFHIEDSFYESIIEWYKNIHHLEIKKEYIVPSIGTITSLNLLTDCFSRNQRIAIMTPVYGPFENCANVGHVYHLPLINKETTYEIDFEGLERLCLNQKITTLLLCNPHNPGGVAWKKEELLRLVQLCKKYDLFLFVDEIHGEIELIEDNFTSMVEFFSVYDKIFISTSPNKTFNISGLTTSYMLCPNLTLIEQFNQYFNHLHLGYNRMGIKMIEIVYRYGKSWYFELLKYLRTNYKMVNDILSKTNLKHMFVDCGFLIWIKLPEINDVDDFVIELAKNTHVLVETGSRFITDYEGYIRINMATDYDLLEKAMNLLVEFYTKKVTANKQ